MFARLFSAIALSSLLIAPAFAAPKTPAKDPIVARVNGAVIHRSDLKLAMESLPQQYRALPLKVLYKPLLNQIVDRELIAQAAEREKLTQDPEVKQRLAVARQQALESVYIERQLKGEVTEAKLQALYEAKVKTMKPVEEVRARHILVKTKAEAEAIIADLKKGANFAKLAKEKSIDPSASNGGELGYFTEDQMVPSFAKAAFALKPGQYSQTPVHTPFGWHVIEVEARRTKPVPTFKEMEPKLRQEAIQNVIANVVEKLRGKAKVQLYNEDGSPMSAAPNKAAPKK